MKIKDLAKAVEKHPDTLYKIRRGNCGPSTKLADRLEKVTGIPVLMWLYPSQYGNPWKLLEKMGRLSSK